MIREGHLGTLSAKFLMLFLSCELFAPNSQIQTQWALLSNTLSSDEPYWFCSWLGPLLRSAFSKADTNREGCRPHCSSTHPPPPCPGNGLREDQIFLLILRVPQVCPVNQAKQPSLDLASSKNGWELLPIGTK